MKSWAETASGDLAVLVKDMYLHMQRNPRIPETNDRYKPENWTLPDPDSNHIDVSIKRLEFHYSILISVSDSSKTPFYCYDNFPLDYTFSEKSADSIIDMHMTRFFGTLREISMEDRDRAQVRLQRLTSFLEGFENGDEGHFPKARFPKPTSRRNQ